MNVLSSCVGALGRLSILACLSFAASTANGAGVSTNATAAEPFDFAQPALLTGNVYAKGANHTNVLFTIRRTATRSGSTVRVERTFDRPDGSPAAVETIVYVSGRFISYEMKELQAGVWGMAKIVPDSKNPARQRIITNVGSNAEAKTKSGEGVLPPNSQINDSVYAAVMEHWQELQAGTTIKIQMVSLIGDATYGFKLAKATESEVKGVPVVCIRMEPTSLLVAMFMGPVYLYIEKAVPHRIAEYVGLTTPLVKKGKSWKGLEADTVFNWP